jgi:hypothetical protein
MAFLQNDDECELEISPPGARLRAPLSWTKSPAEKKQDLLSPESCALKDRLYSLKEGNSWATPQKQIVSSSSPNCLAASSKGTEAMEEEPLPEISQGSTHSSQVGKSKAESAEAQKDHTAANPPDALPAQKKSRKSDQIRAKKEADT